MKIESIKSKLSLALVMMLVGIVMPSAELIAQSGSTQGSDTRGSDTRGSATRGDPFQLPPQGGDDPFQLPGLQPAPDQDPIAAAEAFARQLQSNTVNEKYAGWREASDGFDGNRLESTLRANWVMADESGKLAGTIYGIEDADIGKLTIYLLNRGREVTQLQPNEDGTFLFSNIREGVYSLIGWGDNAFFAFGMNVIKYNPAADASVATDLKITATQNETTINTDWIKFFAQEVQFPVYGRYDTGETDSDPARLYGVAGQSLQLPASRPQTSTSSHQIIPAPDGRVIGRVHQMTSSSGRPVDLQGTRIMLLQNDDVYAAVTTDAYGVFEFPELPAGEYSCVAVGQDGLGCIGIYLGETPADSGEIDDFDDDEDDLELEGYTPISFTMIPSDATGWLNNRAIETAYQRVISRPRQNMEMPEQQFGSGNRNRHNCGPGSLRPGGYRPQGRSSIPRDQRFIPRANRFIDNLFTRDAEGF